MRRIHSRARRGRPREAGPALAIATAPPLAADAAADAPRKDLPFESAEGGWKAAGCAAVAAAMYFVGAEVGMALVFDSAPLSILWPPNALLFAALLLAPTRWWWLILLSVLPVHLLAELQSGVELPMSLGWYVSNTSEALIGAAFVRRLAGPSIGLDTVRSTIVFLAGTVLAVFVSCFLDASFVRLIQPSSPGYWTLWQTRFSANVLSTLTFVPIVVTSVMAQQGQFRSAGRFWWIEPAVLLSGLMAISVAIFDSDLSRPSISPALLYLPMPFLVWAALRFGPPLTSATFTMVAFLVVWGSHHGRGPFQQVSSHADVLPIQLFLIATAVPLLLLAAVIEERRNSERKLRASEDLFSTAFRSSPDAIAISRRSDGRVIEANDRWLALLGYEPDQFEHGGIASLADHADEPSRIRLALAQDAGPVRDAAITLRDCHGAVRHALVSITGVEVQGQPCELSIIRDVTEQRLAENEAREQRQQLTHLTRVAAVTELSGTLAHELNQPLTAILSNAQAALRFLSIDPYNVDEIRSILIEIAEEDKRAGQLIHHLRLLMKKGARGDDEFARIDMNQLVRDVLGFVHGECVTRDVDVTASYWPDLPHVVGDRVQLQQLVLNLVSNAYEAMRHPTAAKSIGVTTVHGYDDTVQLVVSDSGHGITPDKLEKVFEPFYTTKENGLGLGLSICRKIARAHGGSLVADSREGEGAIFRLVLPRADSHERPVPAAERR